MNPARIHDYIWSLPERLARSFTGLAAGAAKEVGEVVLPHRLRRSRLYNSIVDTTLRFLIEQVGQMEQVNSADSPPLPEDFFIRRASGNVFELAGIVAFHASPVWVLAAIADLAGGGRDLIGEIAHTLEKEGLLERGRNYQNVDQLLDGLERTAGRLAETVNTPPLNVAALREEWTKLRFEASGIPRASLPDVRQMADQWRELQQEADQQGRSVLELSSVMAVTAIRSLPQNALWLSRVVATSGRRAGEVLASGLFGHYRKTLSEIRTVGYLSYWLREFRPYLTGAVRQFSLQRQSSTERFLLSRRAKFKER